MNPYWKRIGLSAVVLMLLSSWGVTDTYAGPDRRISGRVVDATPRCTEADFLALEQAIGGTEEELRPLLMKILGKPRPPVRAVVTARGMHVTKQAICDADGRYVIDDLPHGIYEVWAQVRDDAENGRDEKIVMSSAVHRVRTSSGASLSVYEQLVFVSGCVRDHQGRPIGGAKVTGLLVPFLEVGLTQEVSTTTDKDGNYELGGFAPVGLYRMAGYLNGGSLDAIGALNTQVEIRVAAEGYEQAKEQRKRVPLIAEVHLPRARRLWQALSKIAEASGKEHDLEEMKPKYLPDSRGNRILDIDITLEKQIDGVSETGDMQPR